MGASAGTHVVKGRIAFGTKRTFRDRRPPTPSKAWQSARHGQRCWHLPSIWEMSDWIKATTKRRLDWEWIDLNE
jgi:hypothetical protein